MLELKRIEGNTSRECGSAKVMRKPIRQSRDANGSSKSCELFQLERSDGIKSTPKIPHEDITTLTRATRLDPSPAILEHDCSITIDGHASDASKDGGDPGTEGCMPLTQNAWRWGPASS